MLGGVAGDEINRLNVDLGSPAHARLLARVTGHNQSVEMFVLEDNAKNFNTVIVAQAKTVSADIVYFETKNHGAVFSAGASLRCGSLSYNGFDDNDPGITENVRGRFVG